MPLKASLMRYLSLSESIASSWLGKIRQKLQMDYIQHYVTTILQEEIIGGLWENPKPQRI